MQIDGKTAFVFPGQGSQSVGMLGPLAAEYPAIIDTFAEASDVLHLDLWRLCQSGPVEQLNRTENTQPALLAAGIAMWRLWRQMDGRSPELMAGHSLGEYSALVAAGSLDFTEAVELVAERGRKMQLAVPAGEGAMAAVIGLEDQAVEAVCEQAAKEQCVSAANYNAPGQVVIAGHTAAVERAMAAAKDQGAKRTLPLPVSVPSHCALMRPAADALEPKLVKATVTSPKIPVLHNVDVASYDDPDAIRRMLLQQLYRPVQWTQTIQRMARCGVAHIVECGPGKVLTGLVRRIDRKLEVFNIDGPENLARCMDTVNK